MKYKKIGVILGFAGFLLVSLCSYGQHTDSVGPERSLTLDQCIQYALKHQPALNQALLGVPIAKATNAISLSGWLPQVNIGGNLTHYLSLPTAVIPDSSGKTTLRRTGINNTAAPV